MLRSRGLSLALLVIVQYRLDPNVELRKFRR